MYWGVDGRKGMGKGEDRLVGWASEVVDEEYVMVSSRIRPLHISALCVYI